MNWKISQAAMLVLMLALSAGNAMAHSKKEATQPANGAVLETSPEVIGMTFDMPMRVTLLSLIDQDAKEHALTRTDNMQPVSEFVAAPAVLPAGQYKVEWRGLAGDGHPMQGTFSFEIAN
jgi:methionine-rich copper-binding protein CopC